MKWHFGGYSYIVGNEGVEKKMKTALSPGATGATMSTKFLFPASKQ